MIKWKWHNRAKVQKSIPGNLTSQSPKATSEKMEKPDPITPTSDPQEKSLVSALKGVKLDVDFWLKALESTCGVTDYVQLQFIDIPSFESLARHTRHTWETNALKELIGIEQSYEKANNKRKQETQAQEQELKELLEDLKSMEDGCQVKSEKLAKEKEEQLRQVLDVPESDWIKARKDVTIADIIAKFKSHLGDLNKVSSNHHELSVSELLERASGGLALKGILITNDEKECAELRKAVLQVPRDVQLKAAISKQRDDVVEFTSHLEADLFQRSLDAFGHSVATSEKGSRLGFKSGVAFSETSREEEKKESEVHKSEVYLFREMYSYVPTAVCEMNPLTLKLSENVLVELRTIDRLVDGTEKPETIKKKCTDFFTKYGSHVNVGMIQFGGLYEWVATYSSTGNSNKEKVQGMVKEVLNGFISLSFAGVGITTAGSVDGDQVKNHAGVAGSHDSSELSKVSLHVTKKGGPQEISSLPLWKMGLMKYNDTWAIIDRGNNFVRDFVGIWQLIHNHAIEFRNATKLADTLQRAWWLMSGMPPSCLPESDKIVVAIESMSELRDRVSDWLVDESLTRNAIEYLQKLLNHVEQTCSDTGDNKYWADALKNDQTFAEFFKCLAGKKSEYSPSHVFHIQYLLRKLIALANDPEFSDKGAIIEWIQVSQNEEYMPSVLRDGPIQDIGKLLQTVKVTLLPAMQVAHAKAKLARKSRDVVDIQATVDLALAVDHLRTHLDNSGKQYELFLLLSILGTMTFNPVRKSFDVLLTEETLIGFINNCEEVWKEFQVYRNASSMKLQAFLLHFLVTSVPSNEDPHCREQEFLESMKGIQDLLTPEVNLLLVQFTAHTPYNWKKLATNLNELKNGNQQILKSETIDIKDLEVITQQYNINNLETDGDSSDSSLPEEDSDVGKLLQRLGLIECYPSKISVQDVMAVGTRSPTEDCQSPKLPWLILRKLIMLDYNGRDGFLGNVAPKPERQTSENPEEDEEDAFSTIDDILSGFEESEGSEPLILNSLDVFITIYSCCDLILKQTLLQKMFLCRLAVPFILPQLSGNVFTYSLWALRSIIVEWRNQDQLALETSVVCHPTKIVSFIRLGRPACSKSILLNNVISNQAQHTFWNRDCPQGRSVRSLANGLVEAEWYLPAGKGTDIFEDVTMFLNLRGNGCEHSTQVQLMQDISNVIICCIDISDLENGEILDTMKRLHCSSAKIILLLVTKEADSLTPEVLKQQLQHYISHIGKSNMTNTKQVSGFRGTREKNIDELKQELRDTLGKLLHKQYGKSIEQASGVAKAMGIDIDESNELCQYGKRLADQVMACMNGKSTNECKKEMLPLQGHSWHEWSRLLKRKHQAGGKEIKSNIIHEMAVIQQNMTSLRQNQLHICNNLSPLMKTFLQNLLAVVDSPTSVLYLQWLALYLDEKSRKTLPILHEDYHKKWCQFKVARDNADDTEMVQRDLEAAEQRLAGASLGLEHLLREVAQMYEAAIESNFELKQSTRENIEQLPKVVAQLLLKGQPMEIMDGDASNVPLTWVKAVFSNAIKFIGDKKLFVISVLGIQSSGKSTLLNTMFGLKFAVSAGRCTRGVYMQLLEVDKRSNLPYDYVLVIDTEGLRAPELNQLKHSHDNELATLVIGLGDVTIMNVKGENVAEMADVLQIAVHAFLRMKIINRNFQLHRTCVFIHQNVPAINAKEKMRHGCQKLQESLDEMTVEACAIENIADVHTFNQVIDFDGQRHVWYFSDLWHGDPPMAPANPGYTEKVQEVKECLLNDLAQKQQTFLSFSDMSLRIQDLWTGVLSDDFVFSFRNSLAAKAYNNLETTYYEMTWKIEKGIMDWVTQTAIVELERCTTSEALEMCCSKLFNDLEVEVSTKHEHVHTQLETFFETSNLRDILIQWQVEKIESLNTDTKTFLNRAKREILQKKDSLRIDLLQKVTQEKHEVEIMRKAKELADAMKGKEVDDEELHNKFDCVWIQWLNELANRSTITTTSVEVIVEQLLWQRLAKDSAAIRIELRKNPLSKPLDVDILEGSIKVGNIKQAHLSVRTSVGQSIKSFFSGSDPWLQCRHTAVQAINIILRKVDVYLKDICKQDSRFQESYATYVIKSVVDGVQEHNHQYMKQYPFTLLPNLMVKLAVHVCRYAVVVFKKMQTDYEENHGVAKKLNAYKNTAWNLFKNIVHQSTKEVIAADLLYDGLHEMLKKTVKRRLTGDVLEETVHHFGRKKHNLILAILDDLALKGNFESYRSFLTNSKDYSLKWITAFTNERFFSTGEGTTTLYANHAQRHIRAIAQGIEKSIRTSTECVTRQAHPNITTWGKRFCLTLIELPIIGYDLKHMMEIDVADFHNLERLLMERLLDLEERILEEFINRTAENIKWEGTTPYRQIISKLWGCEAQCPFCSEPCQRTDPNHISKNDSHQCIQHRPSGLGGDRWDETYRKDRLVVESCNYHVQCQGLHFSCRDCNFECRKSEFCSTEGADWKYHENTHYKTFLPHWDITPSSSMDSSLYWMWFMTTYQNQLKNMYNAELPDIPNAWRSISVQQAITSLRVYSN